MKVNVISQAAGSAYLELQNTKVICGVYGPRQPSGKKTIFSETGRLETDVRFTTYSNKDERQSFIPDKMEKDLSTRITEALQVSVILSKFPKSIVELFFIVIEDDGGALPACITCGSLALANAGIEMFDLVSACSVGWLDPEPLSAISSKTNSDKNHNSNNNNSRPTSQREERVLALDPTWNEAKYQRGTMTVAFMQSRNEVTLLTQTGQLEYQQIQEAFELLVDVCTKMVQFMNSALIQAKIHSQKTSETK